ncbi:hypothetical protein SAMN05216361_0611 [Marisediminitalea aggregata]|jgi:uncharacterized membrane protein|uniref:Uncharacterized protein n=1 Tax=Marisediminitalea aggregata TaxID=634436 RepID=A0A1M5EZ60_9ALTE|nr:hypothetical protein [Aestuariibacter sp.]SHF84563.1 hypothetical protein SAMN05216361_0611 [Marisediminitalea aggregata]
MVTHKPVFTKHASEFRVKGLLTDPNLYCFLIGVGLLVGIDVLFSAI